jgi:hypothetical protein
MIWCIYLTAVGLTPGSSSTSHIYTPGGSSTSHIYTPGSSSTSHIYTPGSSSTSHIYTPGGSSTSHIYTQTIHKIQRKENLVSAGRALSLPVIPWHLPYNWGKSTEKPQLGEQNTVTIDLQYTEEKTVTQHRTTKNTEYTTEKIVSKPCVNVSCDMILPAAPWSWGWQTGIADTELPPRVHLGLKLAGPLCAAI